MKTKLSRKRKAGYALIMVLVMCAISILVLSGSMRRTSTVAMLNDRNNQYMVNCNAAEAAIEKVYARMAYDFQGGMALVMGNINNGFYASLIPDGTNESAFWKNFQFSNGQGQINKTYIGFISNYSGPLPSQYTGLFAVNSPIYRVLSNVKATKGRYMNMTNAVQTDVLFALLPLTQYAIFYNGPLEFSTCATMIVNGRTHSNTNIYVGSGSALTFNGIVTAGGTITSPANNGSGPWTFPGNVSFNGTPPPSYKTNVPVVTISVSMTNTHSLIDMPPASEPLTSFQAQARLYNQAQVVLLISNTTATCRIQTYPAVGQLPGQDGSPVVLTANWTNANAAATNVYLVTRTNFPFLSLTNRFYDQRENKTNFVTQIDVGKYRQWLATDPSVLSKYPAGTYATILYVADNRTNNANQLSVVRATNGTVLPVNGGAGWSIATPNPLYVWKDYNCTNTAYLGTTNTSATVPAAFISDSVTILSASWNDNTSYTDSSTGPAAAPITTVNAALLTGVKSSTSTATTGFSGGVHNLPRLLEDWGGCHLWLNTSIINLYDSTKANGQFITPGSGSYYVPPTRHFTFDTQFLKADRTPPGIPCALWPNRINWAVPPPGVVNYYAGQ